MRQLKSPGIKEGRRLYLETKKVVKQEAAEAAQGIFQRETRKDVELLGAVPGDQIWDVPNGGI